jgi:hypothetical protein
MERNNAGFSVHAIAYAKLLALINTSPWQGQWNQSHPQVHVALKLGTEEKTNTDREIWSFYKLR